MPLGSGRRQTVFSASSAIAAVCIKKAEFDVPSTLSILANQYDLTKRELAVLVASVDFGTVPQVAAVMGLSAETVKTHLKSIYQKTGARRQGDLVKLAAGIASPFAPSRT
jgi:DNA-binding CsgD family transcriptional regulator